MRALETSWTRSPYWPALLAFSLGAVPVPAQTVYDVAADFSATSNSNEAWSYGWSPTLGGSFFLDTDHHVREGLDTWRTNIAPDGNPGIYHNGTGMDLTLGGSALYDEDELGLHPGPNGEYAVIRWTAPDDGVIALGAAFFGEDFVGPTSTDAHVLHNGHALFDAFIEGFGFSSTRSLSTYLFVSRGDTIDFAVGFGRDFNYLFDSTGLRATVVLNP